MKHIFRINIFTVDSLLLYIFKVFNFTVWSNIQSSNQISMNDDVIFTFIRFISQYDINDYLDPGTFTSLLSLFSFYSSIHVFG